ncbi:MAG TPA: hypothetical protein VF002_03435 [Gaiellaceae bacterium]
MGISLRPQAPARPQPTRRRELETLHELNRALVHERQQLRSEGARAEELERNRLAIVNCQWELSRALIERHLPAAASSAAYA